MKKNIEEQKILIIEDNPGDSRLIKEMLKEITSFNYQLIIAETLKEGSEQIKKNTFIFILLDLNLPDSSGKQTFITIMKVAKDTPIILVSGIQDLELSVSLIKEGAQDYIIKNDLNKILLEKTIQYALIRKQVEQKHKENEIKYKTVADFTYDWEFWTSPENEYIYISPACQRITGCTPNEFKENPDLLYQIIFNEDLEAYQAHENFVYESKTSNEIDFRIITKQGEIRWINHICQAVFDENKNFNGVRGSNRDITNRKQTELLLQEKKEVIEAQNEEYQQINEELTQTNIQLQTASEKAKTSAERYQNLLVNLETGIVVHAPDTSIVSNNPRASILLGLSEDQMKGKVAIDREWQFVTENQTPLSLEKYPVNQIVSSRKPIKDQILGIRQPGQSDIVWVTVNGFPAFDNSGEISEIVISFNDITEHKQAEHLLQEKKEVIEAQNEEYQQINEELTQTNIQLHTASEKAKISGERYLNLLVNLETGIVVYAPDTSIVSNNPRASILLGLSNDQLKGKVAIDREWQFVTENHTPLPLQEYPVNRIISGRKPIKDQILGIRQPGKTDIIWVAVNGFPAFNNSGGISEIVISFNEITERKQAEAELKGSKEYLENIINAVASPIFVKDDKHKFYLVNDALCSLVNLSVDKIIGTTGYEFFHKEQMKIFIAKDQELFKTGKENIDEEQLTDGKGKIRTIVTHKTLYTDTTGNKFLVGVINDVTENRKYEKELVIEKEHAQQSDRLKSAFLANMSHEIRTPMNGILGFSELLKEPGLTGNQQQEYIRIIEKSGARMLSIINDIVDISKIEAGLMTANVTEININTKIEYIYTFFKPQIEEKGMQFILKNTLSTTEATIRTDREKVYSILTNLVKNAIKYSDEGIIEVGCIKKDAALQFYVKDSGIGISKDKLIVIFDRFIQADISNKMALNGAGLGLSISKAYVEMLGGKIWVESEVGIGSTFYFTLPYNTEPLIKTINQQLELSRKTDNVKKLKILIVEDDEISEMLIDIIVKPFGKEILKVRTVVKAFETCRDNPDIDLILMDMQITDFEGYEATRQIRQFNKDVIIIALTVYGISWDRKKTIEAGCDDYITKPIGKNELQALIQKYFK